MTIVSSSIVMDNEQSDGRRHIRVRFIDDQARAHDVTRLVVENFLYADVKADWEARKEAQLADQDFEADRQQKEDDGFRRLWTKWMSMTITERRTFVTGLSAGEEQEMTLRIEGLV